jgi:hypothetical protein
MSLDSIVDGELAPGRYRLSVPATIRALRDEVTAAGWTMCVVDGAAMTDRSSLLSEFATGCDFPGWFGGNWDAFADCLRDLSWLPDRPIAVFWQRSGVFEAADPDVWRTAGEVIDRAIADRVEIGVPPLYVIYPAARATGPGAGVSCGGGPALRPVR